MKNNRVGLLLAIILFFVASTAVAGEWMADKFSSKVLGRDYPLATGNLIRTP